MNVRSYFFFWKSKKTACKVLTRINKGTWNIALDKALFSTKKYLYFSCLFVLRFYGPVNLMGSCRGRPVYLTTRLLGRLSPLSG